MNVFTALPKYKTIVTMKIIESLQIQQKLDWYNPQYTLILTKNRNRVISVSELHRLWKYILYLACAVNIAANFLAVLLFCGKG